FQFWTKSSNPIKDKNGLLQLYKAGFLVSIPVHMPTKTKTFWNCMNRALKDNNKSHDGKRRILSIIADQFTYAEIESNLK
ncbi:10881_t:CDS:1, partial [Gigaspora margarita]